ncbi:MAG: type IV secretory system conjugative DNA transfer family protein [Bacteroidales bacterium]|nr:type IV secretory system conjugative DNA transfer family protein [Bacteroidales bacterium]
MENFIALIFQLFISIAGLVLKAFRWLVNLLFSGIKYASSQAKYKKDEKLLNDLVFDIDNALQTAKEKLKMSESVIGVIPSTVPEFNELNDLVSYCKMVIKELQTASDNLQQDISSSTADGIGQIMMKYQRTRNYMSSIRYSMNDDKILSLAKKYNGIHHFIDTMLNYAGVNNIVRNDNEWKYDFNQIRYSLLLDEFSKNVSIKAVPDKPIKFINRNNNVAYSKLSTSLPLLHFNENNELEFNLVRRTDELDHYDVYEFFDHVNHLMHKNEINAYANQYSITKQCAEDIEDNVVRILQGMKKIAPPPVDYMSDMEKMHGGKQRWAQLADVRSAGMLKEEGFIIGKIGYGSYLYTGNYSSHILTIASTGSGKGVGVIIPNLLRHIGSAVILDPKGENFLVTANRRGKLGNKVYYYDPWEIIDGYNQKNHGCVVPSAIKAQINPLDFIEEEGDLIDTAKMIAASLIIRTDSSSAFFYNEAEMFLARLIIYICTAFKKGDSRRNLVELRRLVMIPSQNLMLELIKYAKGNPNVHPIVDDLINWLHTNIQSGVKSFSNIYSFVQQGTDFMSSKKVQDSLMTSNIDIMKLKTTPTSLYLILDMDKLLFVGDNYKPLVRLIITTCMIGASVREKADDKLLFMLDEIAQLGNLQYLPNLLSIYSGKGVVVWTIWQNIAQIQANYDKEWQSIVGNCAVQQYFGVNDMDTAELVSKKAGQTTIYKESHTTTVGTSWGESESTSNGTSHSRGTSNSKGTNTGYSYQGFNYTSSGGSNESVGSSENYTDSYNFSRTIQIGHSRSVGTTLSKETVPLITPFEVTTGNKYSIQFVFYMGKCPYPILSGKIKYYEDKEFYGEYSKNLALYR